MKRKNSLLLSIIILLSVSQSNADVEVTEYLDRESSGWSYKVSDYAFVAEKRGCRIQWNAIEGKSGERSLEVNRDCKVNFAEQLPSHRAILTRINQKWPLSSFKEILWGPLCDNGDWTWCRPIARASLKSPEYIDYWQNYPNSKLKGVNSLFREFANSTDSYADLSRLMNEFGVKIELGSVEKVFAARLNESPFSGEFDQAAIDSNSKVMFNVGIAYFYISEHKAY
ncbi:hypothetical protein MNBD_GAMMA26-1179 [hydrothermal vent metagenome]|uniref:Uncharacterized protein n=1 Tax=hydrothermal vent metagenome TaxID=652676 RepID=A0A3B1BCT4_9ZZZZ